MACSMNAYGMTFIDDPFIELEFLFALLINYKECSLGVVFLKDIKNLGCNLGIGSVIKS